MPTDMGFDTDTAAMIAHDLRNDLNCVKVYTEVYEGDDLDPGKRREYAERIAGLIDNVLSMLKDLERLSTNEAGRKGVLVLEDLVKGVVRGSEEMAWKKGVRLESRVPACRSYVKGDKERLGRVVANLIATALKFTPPGGEVQVLVGYEGKNIRVEVRDTGEGIALEHPGRLFEKFYKANDGLREGLGLELYIAREFVREHGGSLFVNSGGIGRGAKFSFTLPCLWSDLSQRQADSVTSMRLL